MAAESSTRVFCIHTREVSPNPTQHARDHMLERFSIEAECVILKTYDADKPWDLVRQKAHLEAIKRASALNFDSSVLFVESDVLVSRDPREEIAGPPGLHFDMLCMSGSATHVNMARLPDLESGASLEEYVEDPEDPEVLDSSLVEKKSIVLYRNSPDVDFTGAVFRDSVLTSLRITPESLGMLRSRGPIPKGPGLMDLLYSRLVEMVHVETKTIGSPRLLPDRDALLRRRWINALPTTLTCYALTRKGLEKAAKLLEYTIAESPLPNVLSYEKHVRGRLDCYLLLSPVCNDRFDPAIDYIHTLSGLREFPVNRKPLQIRSAKMDDSGTRVYLGVLPDSELPKVSILTITRNRRRIFNIAKYMFLSQEYPKDKLEWVIVDDSEDGQDVYPTLGQLRDDPRVVYRKLKTENGKPFRIGHKRQLSCQFATGDVFVHLDDDDFLPPMGVMVRVRALLEYKAQCMGATYMLSYVFKTGRTFFTTVSDVHGDLLCFGEPSIAYTRKFWQERGWPVYASMDEGRYFLLGRNYDEFVNVPSSFHCVAITHNKNVTGNLRDGKDVADAAATNFKAADIFPDDLVRLMKSVFKE